MTERSSASKQSQTIGMILDERAENPKWWNREPDWAWSAQS
jgi:hypothetical protein